MPSPKTRNSRNSDTPFEQLKQRLSKDDKWKRFRRIVKNAYLPEFDNYLEELSDLHKSRTARLLSASGFPTGKKVANAASKEIAVRSRAVEICMQITRNRNWLAISLSTMQKHVEAEYSSFLSSIGVKGVTDRRNLAQAVMSVAQKKLDQLDTIVEIADMVIADIDQAGFAIKHINEALQVATRREGM